MTHNLNRMRHEASTGYLDMKFEDHEDFPSSKWGPISLNAVVSISA